MSNTQSGVHLRFTQVISGIEKRIATTVVLANTTYATAASLAQPFKAWIQAAATTASAKAAYHAAVENEAALYKVAQTIWLLLQAYARATFTGDTAALADFGYAPVKRTPATAATRALAAQKAAATRKARGTMSKKQKAKIVGTVLATEPAAPAPVAPVK